MKGRHPGHRGGEGGLNGQERDRHQVGGRDSLLSDTRGVALRDHPGQREKRWKNGTASEPCAAISRGLTRLSLEPQKERGER